MTSLHASLMGTINSSHANSTREDSVSPPQQQQQQQQRKTSPGPSQLSRNGNIGLENGNTFGHYNTATGYHGNHAQLPATPAGSKSHDAENGNSMSMVGESSDSMDECDVGAGDQGTHQLAEDIQRKVKLVDSDYHGDNESLSRASTPVPSTVSKETNLEGLEFDGDTVLCRVCGDKASGFHYGVHACEGCKGFFRRSIQQKIQYRPCLKNQQCNIMRVNRNRCQYCRLKKCIAVGMSRDAVRFGRVPKKEKAKIMEQMQRVNSQSQSNLLSSILENDVEIIQKIIDAHMLHCDFTSAKFRPLFENARESPQYVDCPAHMACPLNPHPDGGESMKKLDEFSECFTPAISSVVSFAKSIPGFQVFSQEDQVTLLKAGTFEVLLLYLACLFDAETNTMMFTNGKLYKRMASGTGFLLDSMFDFAERLNALHLTDQEVALFSAIVIIASDRPGLRNTEQIEQVQNKIMQGLQALMGRNHPDETALFAKLLLKIPDLRTLNTLHSEKLLGLNVPSARQAEHDSATAGAAGMHGVYPGSLFPPGLGDMKSQFPELGSTLPPVGFYGMYGGNHAPQGPPVIPQATLETPNKGHVVLQTPFGTFHRQSQPAMLMEDASGFFRSEDSGIEARDENGNQNKNDAEKLFPTLSRLDLPDDLDTAHRGHTLHQGFVHGDRTGGYPIERPYNGSRNSPVRESGRDSGSTFQVPVLKDLTSSSDVSPVTQALSQTMTPPQSTTVVTAIQGSQPFRDRSRSLPNERPFGRGRKSLDMPVLKSVLATPPLVSHSLNLSLGHASADAINRERSNSISSSTGGGQSLDLERFRQRAYSLTTGNYRQDYDRERTYSFSSNQSTDTDFSRSSSTANFVDPDQPRSRTNSFSSPYAKNTAMEQYRRRANSFAFTTSMKRLHQMQNPNRDRSNSLSSARADLERLRSSNAELPPVDDRMETDSLSVESGYVSDPHTALKRVKHRLEARGHCRPDRTPEKDSPPTSNGGTSSRLSAVMPTLHKMVTSPLTTLSGPTGSTAEGQGGEQMRNSPEGKGRGSKQDTHASAMSTLKEKLLQRIDSQDNIHAATKKGQESLGPPPDSQSQASKHVNLKQMLQAPVQSSPGAYGARPPAPGYPYFPMGYGPALHPALMYQFHPLAMAQYAQMQHLMAQQQAKQLQQSGPGSAWSSPLDRQVAPSFSTPSDQSPASEIAEGGLSRSGVEEGCAEQLGMETGSTECEVTMLTQTHGLHGNRKPAEDGNRPLNLCKSASGSDIKAEPL